MKTEKHSSTPSRIDLSKAKTVCVFGVLGALALALNAVENVLFPAVPFLPAGAKIGLSNVVTMLAGSYFGFFGALYIALLKALFAFVTRGAVAAAMSLCGGVLSVLVLSLLLRKERKQLSFIGVGVLCATAHNFGQLLCSCVVSGAAMLGYGKYLLVFAIVSGSLTGVFLNAVMPRLVKHTVQAADRSR